jgi:hypothetical protein
MRTHTGNATLNTWGDANVLQNTNSNVKMNYEEVYIKLTRMENAESKKLVLPRENSTNIPEFHVRVRQG